MKKYALIALLCAACGDAEKTDAQWQAEVAKGMHDSIAVDMADLLQAAKDLQAAAPTPAGRGWSASLDAAAIVNMKAAWRRCRISYEHIEGAVAPLFQAIDISIDARYDDYLAGLGGAGDVNLFDRTGVTGMHGIERILYADQIPQRVVDFESTLPGYRVAAFPATAAEAVDFKTKLVQQLIDDVTQMQTEWTAATNVDIGAAFTGLVALMNEQREKVNKAATGEEESRYAQMTMFDLRNNLIGTTKIYEIFRPWILSKTNSDPAKDGPMADSLIETQFQSLTSFYGGYPGDAVPAPPATWSSLNPSPADLATPFGMLWSTVKRSVDTTRLGSITYEMNHVAVVLGFPQFVRP